ncbi:MAG: ABC transporter ATP-binding protein, partial [Verrucomicrobiota bacterium]
MSKPKQFQESLPSLWRILKYFWPHMRQQRGLIVTSMLALFVEVGLRLLEPWPLKFVFDRIIHVNKSNTHWNPAWIDSMESMTLLTLAAVSVVILTGLRALASYSSTIGFAQLGNRVLMKVRN